MKQKEYKRPGVRKPESPRSVSTYSKYHHTIDREIDNDNIWYIEINGKKDTRHPVVVGRDEVQGERRLARRGYIEVYREIWKTR